MKPQDSDPLTPLYVRQHVHKLSGMITEVFTVADFRATLTEQIRRVAKDTAARVYVGSRRVPEAVLMSPKNDVPQRIRMMMLDGYISTTADFLVNSEPRLGFAVLPDGAGDVFAWLWESDPDQTPYSVAALLRAIRAHHEHQAYRLDELLGDFRRVFLRGTDYDGFATACRTHIPRIYPAANTT